VFYDSKYINTDHAEHQSYNQNKSNFGTSSHAAIANTDQKDDPLTTLLESVTVI